MYNPMTDPMTAGLTSLLAQFGPKRPTDAANRRAVHTPDVLRRRARNKAARRTRVAQGMARRGKR